MAEPHDTLMEAAAVLDDVEEPELAERVTAIAKDLRVVVLREEEHGDPNGLQ